MSLFYSKIQCPKCKNQISSNVYSRHSHYCDGKIKKRKSPITETLEKIEGKYKCPFCSKLFSSLGISPHLNRAHSFYKTKTKSIERKKERYKSLKDYSKNSPPLLAMNDACFFCGKKFESPSFRRFCSKSCGAKNTVRRTQHFGGWNSKKRVNYVKTDGSIVHLHSSYEEKVAKTLDENNIEWTRPDPLLYLKKGGSRHRYYPDFYLPKFNIYLDPKASYLIDDDKEKISNVENQNGKVIFILTVDELIWEKIRLKIENIFQFST